MSNFGYCPICGSPFGWDSDGCLADRTELEEDQDVLIQYLFCPHCGASAEIVGCSAEERKNYPYWNEEKDKE